MNLFLIRGLPGAGKTSLVHHLIDFDDTFVASDDFMVNANGDYEYNKDRQPEVHGKCLDTVKESMKKKVHRIFVHNTFTTEWELAKYATLAQEYNYKVHYIVKENRHNGISKHGVPPETLSKLQANLEGSIKL